MFALCPSLSPNVTVLLKQHLHFLLQALLRQINIIISMSVNASKRKIFEENSSKRDIIRNRSILLVSTPRHIRSRNRYTLLLLMPEYLQFYHSESVRDNKAERRDKSTALFHINYFNKSGGSEKVTSSQQSSNKAQRLSSFRPPRFSKTYRNPFLNLTP